MNILHTLRSVAHFFRNSRQQGHTTAMLNGALNTKDALVLTHDMRHAQTLARNNPTIDVTAINHIDALTGHRRPVLIDNAAILTICEKAAATIERNQAEIERLETELAQAARDQQTLLIAQQTITDLRVTIAKTEAELAEARLIPLLAMAREQLECGWCHQIMHAPPDFAPPMTHDKLKQTVRIHLKDCPNHPIREIEAELRKATEELEAWRTDKAPDGWWVKHEDHIAEKAKWTEQTEQARLELCKIGLLPDKHQTLDQAIKGALQIAASLRRDLADPPVDVQEAVLTKLGLWETNKIVDAAKKLKSAKGRYHNQIAATELFDLLP